MPVVLCDVCVAGALCEACDVEALCERIGVNMFRLEKTEALEVLEVDNTAVRDSQIKRLHLHGDFVGHPVFVGGFAKRIG